MALGPSLREVRIAKGLTQMELAALLGLEQPQVSAVEVGRRETTTSVLRAWVEACDAEIRIERRRDDPLSQLLSIAADLNPADLTRLTRVARSLPDAPDRAKDVLIRVLEEEATK